MGKRVAILFLVLGLLAQIAWILLRNRGSDSAQAELPYVTSIDPKTPGFTPQVLILSGKVWNSIPYLVWCGNRFELAILGPTNYYYKEWRGQAGRKNGSGYVIVVASGEFAARRRIRWLSFATQGGRERLANEIESGEFLARRLWPTNGFTGVKASESLARQGRRTEEFEQLEEFGNYSLPRKIITTETFNPGQVLRREFSVERVTFSDQPRSDWLTNILQEYSKDDLPKMPIPTNEPSTVAR